MHHLLQNLDGSVGLSVGLWPRDNAKQLKGQQLVRLSFLFVVQLTYVP